MGEKAAKLAADLALAGLVVAAFAVSLYNMDAFKRPVLHLGGLHPAAVWLLALCPPEILTAPAGCATISKSARRVRPGRLENAEQKEWIDTWLRS